MRRPVWLFAVTLAACGVGDSSSPQGGSTNTSPTNTPSGIATQPVGSGALVANAAEAKIVLRTTTPVDEPITVASGVGEYASYVTCTTAADCSGYSADPTLKCSNNLCVVTQQKTSIFYVQNVTPTATAVNGVTTMTASFNVPCDGRSYAAEVYSKDQAGSIQDAKSAPAIVLDTSCQQTTAPVWSDSNKPALAPYVVYVGLPAPLDRYTITIQNLAYPWSSGYTTVCTDTTGSGGSAVTTTVKSLVSVGGTATFTSPGSGTTAVSCAGTFGLDPAILLPADQTSAWQYQATQAATVTTSGAVTAP